jgi:four helix bundle protein
MYRFERLKTWQKAMDFAFTVYQKSKGFPKEEIYGLTSQLRRAATSIPINIAEGSASKTKKEFIQFLMFALRSQYETITILRLAQQFKYLSKDDGKKMEEMSSEVGRLLQGLINSLK